MKLVYTVFADMDDLPVRGNAVDSGDAELDTKVENEILTLLDKGNIWAWASVEVKCSVDIDGVTFAGRDCLGACSYKDENDFKNGGYYDQMKEGARRDLLENLRDAVKLGNKAYKILDNYHV